MSRAKGNAYFICPQRTGTRSFGFLQGWRSKSKSPWKMEASTAKSVIGAPAVWKISFTCPTSCVAAEEKSKLDSEAHGRFLS